MEDFNPGTREQEHSQLFRQESLQPNTFTLDAQSSQAEHLRCTNYILIHDQVHAPEPSEEIYVRYHRK